MKGIIFNIQHYAVHDGPGIRTLLFLKGCPLRCQWCCNPESQRLQPQLRYIRSRCRSCLECVIHCPDSSLSFTDGVIHRSFDDCNRCPSKVCIEVCNHDALTVSGKEITSGELIDIIALDIPFYRNSGGGVTFSGGEPLFQHEFLRNVLQKCKALGIHTAVETCGWADRKSFGRILPFTDLFLFDLKIIDPDLHLFYTGKPVHPVLENLAYLVSEKASIEIRFPLIKGITDTDENRKDIIDIMRKNDLKRICLEPYHALGKPKYEEHGMEFRLGAVDPYDGEELKDFRDFFLERDLACEVL
ncbi:MAG: glycyl-radical enzyme activating protein [Bacteroidales bacterium]|nr:glycyl-radical enzyme activating protein [Lentimicrobiaceae bacterium]MDD5694739.1 glycyl-radical enzyme activating protein [Bacteroidales bacterium]